MSTSTMGDEVLIPLQDLPEHLPKRKGKKLSIPTIYRWVQYGLAGVKLETYYHAGIRCSSMEAIKRFDAKVTAAMNSPGTLPMAKTTDRQAAKAHARAKAKLAKGAK